ncbi:MAG: DUF2853 family protein [Weeksellaceae bacterium]|nr:DUF2853 family protein [Weeksellaceae bacterium]
MSKLQEKVDHFSTKLGEMNQKVDHDLLHAVAKGLGPALYNKDAEFVAASDQTEVDRVKNNFLMKKLGLTEQDNLDEAMQKVFEIMGTSNPRKYRGIVYYLLVKHYNKQSVYGL